MNRNIIASFARGGDAPPCRSPFRPRATRRNAGRSTPSKPPVPRAANGKPDLSGIWILTPCADALRGRGSARGGARGGRGGGPRAAGPAEPPPYKPEAEAKRQEYLARRGIDDPMGRCLLTGVPRIQYRPLPLEIIQLPER